MAGAATVEAEDELVEVGLQVRAAQAVIDAQRPDFQVGEDAVNPGQDDVGGHWADDVRLVGEVRRAGIAGPAFAVAPGARLAPRKAGGPSAEKSAMAANRSRPGRSSFNRRRARHAAFRTLLGIGARITPVTYNMLIKPDAQG